METCRIGIFGCGALGGQIAMHLAVPGRSFVLLDDDDVEVVNLPTSVYFMYHVGCKKAVALAELLYRRAECEVEVLVATLVNRGPLGIMSPALIVDTFDNPEARRLLCRVDVPTIHVGVSESLTGAVIWDERYTVPRGHSRGTNPVCTHDLGRPILRFTAAVAAGVIEEFLATGQRRDLVVTEDMRVLG